MKNAKCSKRTADLATRRAGEDGFILHDGNQSRLPLDFSLCRRVAPRQNLPAGHAGPKAEATGLSCHRMILEWQLCWPTPYAAVLRSGAIPAGVLCVWGTKSTETAWMPSGAPAAPWF